MTEHKYTSKILWTGNTGNGTKDYNSYTRDYTIRISGKSKDIEGSSDPAFKGDVSRYNPEDLLLSSVSSCHMLWYLHLCSDNGIVVLDYVDECDGIMKVNEDGSGKFEEVTLNPIVTILDENNIKKAESLHIEANKMCFIAKSCNFSIKHHSTVVISS